MQWLQLRLVNLDGYERLSDIWSLVHGHAVVDLHYWIETSRHLHFQSASMLTHPPLGDPPLRSRVHCSTTSFRYTVGPSSSNLWAK